MAITYEIHYFPIRARAEPTRMALAAAGAPFKNVTPRWPESQENYTFGQLPALVTTKDGKTTVVVQMMAMLRHVGRVFNLYGKVEDEHTRVDVALDGLYDIQETYVKAYFRSGDRKEEEVAKFSQYLPKQYAFFEKIAAANGDNGHLVGSTLTIADIMLYFVFTSFSAGFTAPPENLKKVISTVESNPKIAEYHASEDFLSQRVL